MTAPQLIIKAHEADPSPCPKYSNLGAVVAGTAGPGWRWVCGDGRGKQGTHCRLTIASHKALQRALNNGRLSRV